VKRKVTITLDERLIPKAKALARRRGLSLSALIERALQQQAPPSDLPFSARWRGRFRPADRADERYRILARKYL
jgi:antitoxin component of RelBE/YafQ-DinJ toxin-antitoxin module